VDGDVPELQVDNANAVFQGGQEMKREAAVVIVDIVIDQIVNLYEDGNDWCDLSIEQQDRITNHLVDRALKIDAGMA